jgi:hypothetical protein
VREVPELLRFREDPQLLRAGGVTHALEGLRLDLPDPLARHPELLADLFERPVVSVAEAVAQTQHPRLAGLQRIEQRESPGPPLGAERRLERRDGLPVLDEVANGAVLVVAARPRWAEVIGDFNVRGGIKTEVRATYGKRPTLDG